MKKWCVTVLALLLLCILSSTAWASEMYDTYGSMDYWDDEVWQQCESWSDEQWEDYWQGEEEAYAQEYEQRKREQRLELGLPDPDGVNVKLNDKFLLFGGNKPRMVDGSAYLPLRDTLAAAGIMADISYDADTQSATVTLTDGRSQIFAAFTEPNIEYPEDEEYLEEYWQLMSSYYSSDAQLLDGSLYVRYWALCELLGWEASFDYYTETLYIVEPEPLIAQIDQSFTIYNRLFQAPGAQLNMEKAYKFSGSIALLGTLYGDKQNDTVSASLDYSGIVQGLNLDVSFTIKLDLKQMQDSLFSSLDEETWKMIKAVGAGQGRLIAGGADGTIYLQSNLLPLIDTRLSARDWLKIDYALTEENIQSVRNLLWEQFSGLSVGSLIYNSVNSYYYGSRDIYANALDQALLWQALLGDANFKVERRGGYDVYTLQTNQQKLQEALQNSDFELPGGEIFSSLFGYYGYGYYGSEPADFNHNLTFRERDGRVQDLQMSATAQTKGYLPVSYTLSLNHDTNHTQAALEIMGRYGGKLNLTFDYSLNETTEAPATAPPEGSRIVTERELDSPRLYLF